MYFKDGYVPHARATYTGDGPYRQDSKMYYPVEGIVINVYPTDHPNNGLGRTLVDVQVTSLHKTLHRIPLGFGKFHKDSPSNKDIEGDDLTDNRQILPPRNVSIYNGTFFTPEVGDVVLIQFVEGLLQKAFVSHYLGSNAQSLVSPDKKETDFIFPREAQLVMRFADLPRSDGMYWPNELPHYRSRLEGTESESPRFITMMNGTSFEIDNESNFHVQTAFADFPPVNADRYDNYRLRVEELREVKKPTSTGDIVFSTTGAAQGRIGLITGRFVSGEEDTEATFTIKDDFSAPHDFTNGIKRALDRRTLDGTILLYTDQSWRGNVQISTQECLLEGNITGKTSLSAQGNISWITDTALIGNILLSAQNCPSGNIDFNSSSSDSGNIIGTARSCGSGDILFNTTSSGSGNAVITSLACESGNVGVNAISNGSGNSSFGSASCDSGIHASGTIFCGAGDAFLTATACGSGTAQLGSGESGNGSVTLGAMNCSLGNVKLGTAQGGQGILEIFSVQAGEGFIDIQSANSELGGINLTSSTNGSGDIKIETTPTTGSGDILVKAAGAGKGQVYLSDALGQSFRLKGHDKNIEIGTVEKIFIGVQQTKTVFTPPIPPIMLLNKYSPIGGLAASQLTVPPIVAPSPTIINSVDAEHPACLADILLEVLQLNVAAVYNAHIHGGVESGGSVTNPPNLPMIIPSTFLSEVVFIA